MSKVAAVCRIYLVALLAACAPWLAHSQVLLDKNDYGPVISSNVWFGSRLPGLTCNMPKAHQITVPICPDCVVIEVRPHMSDPTLVVMEFTSFNSFTNLADYYGSLPNIQQVSARNQSNDTYFSPPQFSHVPYSEFSAALDEIPYVHLEEVRSQSGSNRRITLVAEHDDSYNCVFDHNG
ncbi:hypothetical protein [Halioxenophilus aromaticivorans]|uniref:Uncharacterized protein n=1 Tax=Halioxenophilus aromaticivorans TaxID=1306992 RepID=A0AAV3TXL9_9ALTE